MSGLPFPSPVPESEVAQSSPTLRDPKDCSPPGSSVHGTLQARHLGSIIEQVREKLKKRKKKFFFKLILESCSMSLSLGSKITQRELMTE